MGTKVHANRCINRAIEASQYSEAMNIDWAEFETLTQAQCAMALNFKYTLNLGPMRYGIELEIYTKPWPK